MKLYTLTDIAEIMAGENKKGFANHLFHAKLIWNELLRNTLYAVSSTWLNTSKGNPYSYVTVPKNLEKFLGLFYEGKDGKLVEVSAVEKPYAIKQKPAKKTCGCADPACDCGDCCSAAHTITYQTKAHDIGTEKIWTETCKNGDVIQYREVPTKQFFDGGYSIVTVKDQKRLCNVTVKACGCVEETEDNRRLLLDCCPCFLHGPVLGPGPCCDTKTKVQFEGDRIYFVEGPVQPWYLLVCQESDACDTSLVPEMALRTMFAGIDWSVTSLLPEGMRNPNLVEAKRLNYGRMKWNLVADLNPIDLDKLQKLTDKSIKL